MLSLTVGVNSEYNI